MAMIRCVWPFLPWFSPLHADTVVDYVRVFELVERK